MLCLEFLFCHFFVFWSKSPAHTGLTLETDCVHPHRFALKGIQLNISLLFCSILVFRHLVIKQSKARFSAGWRGTYCKNDQLVPVIPGCCSVPDWLGGPRVRGRARTCWTDYSAQLAWEQPVIPKQEVEEVIAGGRKFVQENSLMAGLMATLKCV